MAENGKTKTDQDDPEQSKRFIDTAKEMQVDESGEWFDRAITTIKLNQVQEHSPSAEKGKENK